jgi:hypothetical protein
LEKEIVEPDRPRPETSFQWSTPAFTTARRSRFPASLLWGIAVLILAAASAAFLLPDLLSSGEQLDLRAFGSGRKVIIEWNSRAVRDVNGGILEVGDGASKHRIPLGRDRLHSGTYDYTRESDEVTATLYAGNREQTVKLTAPK